MVSELFAAGGPAIAIKMTPGDSGHFKVLIDGDLLYDKKATPANQTPTLTKVKEIKAEVKNRIAARTPVAPVT
jgi:predicted Rdx family selenoprotein